MKERHIQKLEINRIQFFSKSLCRTFALAGVTTFIIPAQLISVLFKLPVANSIPRLWHKITGRIIGLRILTYGKVSENTRTLYVSNHASYLDIVALGAIDNINFIAKKEVADWPVLGFLARLQRTIFVERRRVKIRGQREEILSRLEQGAKVVLFAEGTSNDGIHVQPFKSALFSLLHGVADEKRITLQPISIAYTRLDDIPIGRTFMPKLAWYGDMSLLPHLFQLLGFGSITVEIKFHEPVDPSVFKTRHDLAHYCHQIVMKDTIALNAGIYWQQSTSSDRNS